MSSLNNAGLDGRIRNALYSGWIDSEKLIEWFREIKSLLISEGLNITNINLYANDNLTHFTPQIFNKDYIRILTFEQKNQYPQSSIIYNICRKINSESLNYSIAIFFAADTSKPQMDKRTMLSFDFSLLGKINMQKFMSITKKHMLWKKEIVFDTKRNDSPINYLFFQNLNVSNDIKIISE